MKKIGILTYHRTINYGAFLQCYSLVTSIKKRYGENVLVEVVDYETFDEFLVRIKMILKSTSLVDFFQKTKMIRGFYEDQKALLPYSRKRIVSNSPIALSKKLANYYDVIIVGSDAIWNGIDVKSGKINYFLPNVNIPYKMSFAASTNGLNTNLLDESNAVFLKTCLREFCYIGVREAKGVSFVKKVADDINVNRNCDPTCFIDLSDFPDNIQKKFDRYNIDKTKPIICLMTPNERIGKLVYDNYHKDYTIIAIYVYNKYADITLYDLKPSEFAVFFSHVKLLFSFFFHGSYLCLKNGTPVIAVDEDKEPDGDITKIEFLFTNLNIRDWYFRPCEMGVTDEQAMIEKANELLSNNYSSFLKENLGREVKNNESFFLMLDEIVNK